MNNTQLALHSYTDLHGDERPALGQIKHFLFSFQKHSQQAGPGHRRRRSDYRRDGPRYKLRRSDYRRDGPRYKLRSDYRRDGPRQTNEV